MERPVDPSPNPLPQGERAYAVSFARGFLEEVVKNLPLPLRERAGVRGRRLSPTRIGV
jgi:hypothetical protein